MERLAGAFEMLWLVLATLFASWRMMLYLAPTSLSSRIIAMFLGSVVAFVVFLFLSAIIGQVWNDGLKYACRPAHGKAVLVSVMSIVLLTLAAYLAYRGIPVAPWVIFAVTFLVTAPIGRELNYRFD